MRIIEEAQPEVVEVPKQEEVKPQQTKIQEMIATKPTSNTPWNVINTAKKPKAKGWWVFKAPILIYLLLSTAYVFLSGKAIATYANNQMAMYGLLGLHAIVVIMFIMLCVVTRRKKE